MKVYTDIRYNNDSRSRIKILRKISLQRKFLRFAVYQINTITYKYFFFPTNPLNSSYQINKRETIRSISNYNTFSLKRIIVKTNKLLMKTKKQKVNATNIHVIKFHITVDIIRQNNPLLFISISINKRLQFHLQSPLQEKYLFLLIC